MQQFRRVLIHTHYYNSNLIWCTVSRLVDEIVPADHPRREDTIIIICLLYTLSLHYSDFINCFGL